MIRVVVDTNIFVSSFFGGNPRKVIDRWQSGSIFICLSPEIVDEYVAVLKRLGVDEKQLKELLALFSKGHQVIFTSETPRLQVVEKDPSDNKFIECAVALEADYIISGDNALLEIGNYMGIEIFSPKNFLSRYTKE